MSIIRKTKSVKKLLMAFEQIKSAISVVELVELFQEEMNKTTVYRILERLENEGTLHSFTGKKGLKWYAKSMENASSKHHATHPHFQCRICGKTSCLPIDISIPSIPNYNIDSAELLLIGQCEDCIAQYSYGTK